MIAFMRGTIIDQELDNIILEVGGIGYQVLVPVQQMAGALQIGKEIALHTYLHVREDNWTLFGFSHKEQLHIFKLLLTVNGVGARTALAILNLLTPGQIVAAIHKGEYKVFNQVPGIGNKISQRIVLELKEKIKIFGEAEETNIEIADAPVNLAGEQDAVLAMEQLGYSGKEAVLWVRKAQKRLADKNMAINTNSLVKEALQLTLEK